MKQFSVVQQHDWSTGSSPPEDEHGGDGRKEVPQEGLKAQQPVHVHVTGNGHTQVLIVSSHLLSEHHLKVACSQTRCRQYQPRLKSAGCW